VYSSFWSITKNLCGYEFTGLSPRTAYDCLQCQRITGVCHPSCTIGENYVNGILRFKQKRRHRSSVHLSRDPITLCLGLQTKKMEQSKTGGDHRTPLFHLPDGRGTFLSSHSTYHCKRSNKLERSTEFQWHCTSLFSYKLSHSRLTC
jgi:hypothetical protein